MLHSVALAFLLSLLCDAVKLRIGSSFQSNTMNNFSVNVATTTSAHVPLGQEPVFVQHVEGEHHRGTKRLTFVPIPRTAGTTIETFTKDEPSDEDRWGISNSKLHSQKSVGKRGESCYGQHLPPSALPEFFHGKDTFCVVRDPYDRIISEFGYSMGVQGLSYGVHDSCNPSRLNSEVKTWISSLIETPYQHDCHLLPQAAFVYGWDSNSTRVVPAFHGCKHVLHFETLAADFNQLMEQYGYSYRLAVSTPRQFGSSNSCSKLSANDLSEENKRLIAEAFTADFELLGYPKL